MNAVLYADLNCPYCFALGERLYAWGVDLLVERRYVEHAPENAIPLLPADPDVTRVLEEELSDVSRRAPEIALRTPPGLVNTGPAIRLLAFLSLHDPGRAPACGREAARAYWLRGEDISAHDVLARLAREIDVAAAQCDPRAVACAREWTEEWEASGVDIIPAMRGAAGAWGTGILGEREVRDLLG